MKPDFSQVKSGDEEKLAQSLMGGWERGMLNLLKQTLS